MRPVFLLVPVFAVLLGVPAFAVDTNPDEMVESAGGNTSDGGEPIDYCRETCERLHGTTQGREYIDCLRRCVTGDASTATPGSVKQPPARIRDRDVMATKSVNKSVDKSSPKRVQAETNGQPVEAATPPTARPKRKR